MKIAVYLRHRTIAEFRFTKRNAVRLAEQLRGFSVDVYEDEPSFLNALPEAEIVLVWAFKQAWFERAKKLRIISTPAAGRDYFSVTPPSGVTMMYGSYHGVVMGETVAGMVLGVSRGLIPHANAMTTDAHSWPSDLFTNKMRRVYGSHVVILGFGAIGHHISRLLKPFGARITGIRRNPVDRERPGWFDADDRVLAATELDRELPMTDHLICVLPSDPDTTKLMNAERLSRLPHTAYLYNVGRGNVIDEAALAGALHRGELAGAVLDVFDEEPLPENSPLRQAPRAYLYPHVSAITPEYLDLYVDELAGRLV